MGSKESENSLQNYVYSMRNSINDDKVGDKLAADDKKIIEHALKDTMDWLEKNQNSEKVVYEDKLKQLENLCNPIVAKICSAGTPQSGTTTNSENTGPKIVEVD